MLGFPGNLPRPRRVTYQMLRAATTIAEAAKPATIHAGAGWRARKWEAWNIA
ncbi:hypothetical protein MSAS_23630 [Mycobacterium saskatchewanense]|uniref:hypothetical protein n=1 Tax=Mycobacterium saskatchewanense TaxID=220927 RepID=UPI001302641E|nr:hypothetical protein [Mycobacterium saskatchewanense]BBX63189.1 hypothetical protein MSAS_23630 [Mycobacterium saskatchewanense]